MTVTKIILKAIKGMAGPMTEVKEMSEIKEEDNTSKRQETPGMNLMLLTTSKMNIAYQQPSLPGSNLRWLQAAMPGGARQQYPKEPARKA